MIGTYKAYQCHCGNKSSIPLIRGHCVVCRCDGHGTDSCGRLCTVCRADRDRARGNRG